MADRNVLVNENSLMAIADAIRNKTNSSNVYTPAQMANAINGISLSGNGTPVIGIEDTIDTYGGTVKNITAVDISDTTATAIDVTKGKTFYDSRGIKTIGTSEITSGWARPTNWPNLSLMDIQEQVLYLSYMADEKHGFCEFKVRPAYTVEIGDIVNGHFVADTTYNLADNATCRHYFGSTSGGYKVIRITSSNNIYTIDQLTGTGVYAFDEENKFSTSSGLLEVYGNLPYLTSLSMDSSYWLESCIIKNVKPTTALNMFQYDYVLQNTNFSTWNFSNCSSMSAMFRDCISLKTVSINGVGSTLTTTENMFSGCFSLENVSLTNFNTSNLTNCANMFNNCSVLKNISIPNNFIQNKVTNASSMFSNARILENIDLSLSNPEKVTNFSSTFNGLFNIKEIRLPSAFVKSAATNLSSMFSGCRYLQSINVSGWNTTNVTNMSSFAQNAYWLQGITGFNTLDLGKCTNTQNMFNSLYEIPSITIPDTLTVISANTFPNTRGTYEYHFLATTPPSLASTNAFNNMGDFGGKKIYVPYSADHSTLNSYKTATNWATYASYMIEEEV